jgi:predicted transcriptional regulator
MSAVKDDMVKVIQDQPEDATYDEILKELAFLRMVDRGLAQSKAGQTISTEELQRRVASWRR